MHFIKIIIVISLFLSPFTPVAQSTNTFNVAVEVNDQIITNYEISQRMKIQIKYCLNLKSLGQILKKKFIILYFILQGVYADTEGSQLRVVSFPSRWLR